MWELHQPQSYRAGARLSLSSAQNQQCSSWTPVLISLVLKMKIHLRFCLRFQLQETNMNAKNVFPCTTSIAVQSLLFGIWSAMIREGADCWAKWALCTLDFQNKPGLHCFWADQTRLSKQWTLIFLVCILLECERTKTKILHFYIGTKCIPFKKGPKLCASDFGDVQKNMIYLVWRCPTFEGPIFMLEQERWQRWLKKPEQILQILLLFGIVLAGSQLMTIVAPFSHEGASKVKKWGQMTISKTLLLCVMCYACGSAAAYAHDGPICIINKSLHGEDINQLVVLK